MMNSEVSPENRRQHRRARLAVAVKEQYQDDIFLSQASDISAEGIFLATATEVAGASSRSLAGQGEDAGSPSANLRVPGAKCWLEFSLPNSPVPIKARGLVIRQTQYQRYQLTAIQFAAIAPSHRRLILDYVSEPLTPPMPTFLPPQI